MHFMVSDKAKRLESARKAAGYESSSDAARALGLSPGTYNGHENGFRGFKDKSAEMYARKFGVNIEWLLLNKGPRKRGEDAPRPESEAYTVPLVGYVAAGSETHFFNDAGKLDDVKAPDGASEETVAVEIRGESLGPLFDRWLVFYDDVQRPVTSDQINKLCVVGLTDGRILVKKIQKAKGRQGLFHLLSNGVEPPILDVEIEWAARVKSMVPR
jgi:phage repressor protein C with HTH and peptisase S24 domain